MPARTERVSEPSATRFTTRYGRTISERERLGRDEQRSDRKNVGVREKKEEKDEARDEARDKLVVNAEPLKKIVGS